MLVDADILSSLQALSDYGKGSRMPKVTGGGEGIQEHI
jgi:hypothetical protein